MASVVLVVIAAIFDRRWHLRCDWSIRGSRVRYPNYGIFQLDCVPGDGVQTRRIDWYRSKTYLRLPACAGQWASRLRCYMALCFSYLGGDLYGISKRTNPIHGKICCANCGKQHCRAYRSARRAAGLFDVTIDDDLWDQNTWEQAESKLFYEAVRKAVEKCGKPLRKWDFVGGDCPTAHRRYLCSQRKSIRLFGLVWRLQHDGRIACRG